MAISYLSENIPLPSFKKRILNKWITDIATSHNKTVGNISYLFCTDEKILEINNQYLNHDYYTDIITFDYSECNKIAGDIVISLDTVKTNSEKFGTDYVEELYRVIIHGVLHLCGINDKTSEEQEIMTDAENKALTVLKEMLSVK
ncbi:MAG: rRNA maturation RNase YbeY [Tannerella sp.]|jgi:rRNA maturation RNase YbeY|nr:rRNA maturation RNase YbeY [Tannerella sp.]